MIIHVMDSPELERCIIDAHGREVVGKLEWVDLDTGEASRFREDDSGNVLFDKDLNPIRETIYISAPVSCLPARQWRSFNVT